MSNEAKKDKSRATDPEVLALSRLGRIMEELPAAGRNRVLMWLVGRYAAAGFHAAVKDESPTPTPTSNGDHAF